MNLTQKDGLELNYWKQTDMEYHAAKLAQYLWAFGHYQLPASALEIGPGPLGGILRFLTRTPRRVGVDPLLDEYRALGLLPSGPEWIAEHFEDWQTAEHFDAVFSTDSLDHGEMGLQLLPKIAGLLSPGGRLYLHLHFRPEARLNESHDHQMREEDLTRHLSGTGLRELSRDWYAHDVDGAFECPTMVGVWELQ